MPRCSASSVRPIGLRTPGAARPRRGCATTSRDAQVGAAAHQLGGGPDEHVGRLERLDAADEEEEHGIRGQAEGGPRLELRPGA